MHIAGYNEVQHPNYHSIGMLSRSFHHPCLVLHNGQGSFGAISSLDSL